MSRRRGVMTVRNHMIVSFWRSTSPEPGAWPIPGWGHAIVILVVALLVAVVR